MSGKLLKEIKERIKEEGALEEIVELNLEQLHIPVITNDIKKLLEKAKNLEMLNLADNDLDNVDNLPKLDLTVLDLSSNKITETSLKRIAEFADLGQLNLSGNQIKTFDGLKPLFGLKRLLDLDLSENPVAELPGYREFIFKSIPTLQYLDHVDKNGNAVQDEEGDGSDEDGEDDEGSDEGSDEDDDDDDSESEKPVKGKNK